MKIVVIGLGVMGKLHARVLNELHVLHGVYDIDQTQAENTAQLYKVKKYNGLSHVLDDHEVDAVTIAIPTPLHMEYAVKCLTHNKHVLLEKPVSNNLKEAQAIVPYVNGLVCAVGYIERHNPAVIYLKTLIDSGELGEITSVNIKRVGGIPRSADNVIVDLMTHDIDILLSLFSREPHKVYTHKVEHSGIVDSAQVLFDFGSASATCEANWISPTKVRTIQVTGTKKYCNVDLINKAVTTYDGITEVTYRPYGEPLKYEMENFIDAINGQAKYVDLQQGIKTLRWTLEANKC